MSLWQEKNVEERQAMLQGASSITGIGEIAVEKDWWVTVTLKALFATSFAPYLLFKGGTSLSKGWKDSGLKRFSEDIDISLSRQWFVRDDESREKYNFAKCENNQQIKLLRKASRKVVIEVLSAQLEQELSHMSVVDFNIDREPAGNTASDADPTVICVNYQSILEGKDEYVSHNVKIEISCLSMDEPFETRDITSLICDTFPNADNESACSIPSVLPVRTFLEKAFLLNEEYQKPHPRSHRMSRHLYDLEKLMNHYAGKALADDELYNKIIAHRKRFYHVGAVDYTTDRKASIRICPPEELAKAYREDYKKMRESFIYEQSPLDYDELIKRLSLLQDAFRQSAE